MFKTNLFFLNKAVVGTTTALSYRQ